MRNYPILLAIALVACGDNQSAPDAHIHIDADDIDAPLPDAPPDAPNDTIVALGSNGANGALWDETQLTLFLTSNTGNKLLAYTDAGGLVDAATLPTVGGSTNLGGMIELASGALEIPSFGSGATNTIDQVASGSNAGVALTGLDGTRKRTALALDLVDANGASYSGYFTGSAGAAVGGVATLTITGTVAVEVPIATTSGATAFKQISGVAATTGAVFAADHTAKTIYKINATAPFAVTALATGLPSAGLLFLLPDGTMLTGGGPMISRISQDGSVDPLVLPGSPTFTEVDGIAYDGTGRLFIVDHTAGGDQLNIIPFTP